jgi:predicted nuclease with TOPRIM domain
MTDISESEKSKSITKDEMIGHIKKWIQYDNDIKQLQADLKEKKENRKQHTERLVDIMKSNEIDCFDVNNGKLMYSKTKVKAPLNKSQMVQALMEYFNNDEPRVRELEDKLMSARKEKITETIRRKINK